MSRPVGITLLGILQVLLGIAALTIGLSFLGAADQIIGGLPGPQGIPPERSWAVGIGWALVLLGLLAWVYAYGLFKLKPWAWWVTLVPQVLSMVGTLFAAATGQAGSPQLLFSLILPLGIVYYLFRPEVKQAFGQSGGHDGG